MNTRPSVIHQLLLMLGDDGDPYWGNVVLLMGYEGADAATGAPGMTDESPAAHGTATMVGNSQIDTAQFKYGTSSLLLDGTGDKISLPDSADWQFDGQFTVECWIRINAFGASTCSIVSHGVSSIAYGWYFSYDNVGNFRFRFDIGGDGTPDHDLQQVAGPVTVGTWHHVAVDRDAANKMRLYVDGVMKASKVSATGTSFNSPGTLDIGYIGSTTIFPVNGWIDEVRITKGVARYASDAGYTVPTAAFPRSL